VLKTVATDGAGIAELRASIDDFRARPAAERAARDRVRQDHRLREALGHAFMRRISETVLPAEWDATIDAIVARRVDHYSAAAAIMRRL
jgi:putative protein kinase ArgK-like GTPase of G3E family